MIDLGSTLLFHARLLGDQVRLKAYRRAIRHVVTASDYVVDLGCGTGILAGYAAERSRRTVQAVERVGELAALAQQISSASTGSDIRVTAARAPAVRLDTCPTVVVTETIGAIGPEEGIVEMCWAFRRRYTHVRTFIPARLTLLAQLIRSSDVDADFRAFRAVMLSASTEQHDYARADDLLEQHYCSTIHSGNLEAAYELTMPLSLVSFFIGETMSSAFKIRLQVGSDQATAVHLFFEAELSRKATLSTHLRSPMTHWCHSWIRIPAALRRQGGELELSYAPGQGYVAARWMQAS